MQLIVTGRHVAVTEAMKQYAREKLSRMMHERPHLNELHMIMDVQKYRHIVEIAARGKNLELFCKEETDDMYISIDRAVAKLDRQLLRYKERHERKQTKSVAPASPGSAPEGEEGLYFSRRFPMNPMYLNEVLLQMKAERHLFYIFLNAETEKVNLLFRINDDEIGCLAPKKIKAPPQQAVYHLSTIREDSIAPGARPRFSKKEIREIGWSTPDEALAAMVAAGEAYRFFMSTLAEDASVVYRQVDGTHALIEPRR